MDPTERSSTEILNGNGHTTHRTDSDPKHTDSLSPLPPVPTSTDAPFHDSTHEKAPAVAPAASQAVDNVMYSDVSYCALLSKLD